MGQMGGRRPGAGRKPGKVGAAKRALAEMAKEHGPAALAVLAKEMHDADTASARISAATAILDRAYGKPPQALEHTGKDGGPIKTQELGRLELARRVAFILSDAAKEEDNGAAGNETR